ncbi:hypothetical protein BGZ46_006492, partial [Entomortierella lignicola]
IGETENIDVTCGNHIVSAPFEVIDQKYAITIGMDLFYRFGFHIQGLPDIADTKSRLAEPIPDERATLRPLNVPEEEKTEAFQSEKKIFLDKIRPLLVINEKIPLSSHCPIPEMKVFLPVPKGTVLYRRSRNFAYYQRPILDEAIEKWLQDDVIALAPAGNPH